MSQDPEQKQLARIANKIRRRIIELIYRGGAGHPGGSLSAAEILTVLYFKVMRIDPTRPDWEDRDRFILSKGHAAPVYYGALVERGYFSEEVFSCYGNIDCCLQEHPDGHTPGVDMGTGSLGQGLSVAAGMALGAKLKGKDLRVFVLLGDGESQEGQIWEAAMASAKFKLDNLIAILDYNRLQAFGVIEISMPIEPIADKWRAFNWHVIEGVDGHNIDELLKAIETAKMVKNKPTIIIANTVKGKGISFMENAVPWHSRVTTDAEREQALAEIAAVEKEI